MIKLVPYKYCINKELYNMYQEMPKNEIGVSNIFYGISYNEFIMKSIPYTLEERIINKSINTKTKRYILFINNIPIGELGIRITLNDYWINKGSQIYYKIRKCERNKGYGNKILLLGLIEAKKLGFDKVRINCDDNNIASKKVIINNGGIIDIKSYKTKNGTSTSYVISL